MQPYLVPAGFGEVEFVEKRSRFIGRVWLTETEEEAVARIREMREKHWDATHNVYAYIIRESGAMRYSDDGEPQGTSGQPVLGVFRSAGIQNVCCVVTRYFGGILLGAGGLVRAYSHTASLALEAAGIASVGLWQRLRIRCPYPLFERVRQELAGSGAILEDTDYAADVCITAAISADEFPALSRRLLDLTAGSVVPEALETVHRAIRRE